MIRLQRIGKRGRPSYRLIVSDKHKDTQAGSIEILGQYNPVEKNKVIAFKADRIKHWLSVGAKPSTTVHNLLVGQGILTGKKVSPVRITAKRKKKLEEKKAA